MQNNTETESGVSLIILDRPTQDKPKLFAVKLGINKYSYIGHDGQNYQTFEELMEANRTFLERRWLPYVGEDGRRYETSSECQQANKAFRLIFLEEDLENCR